MCKFSPKSEKEALQDAMARPDLEPHPMYNQVRQVCRLQNMQHRLHTL